MINKKELNFCNKLINQMTQLINKLNKKQPYNKDKSTNKVLNNMLNKNYN